MTKEIFNKARELTDDIYMLNYNLRKQKKDNYWITISTPYRKRSFYVIKISKGID